MVYKFFFEKLFCKLALFLFFILIFTYPYNHSLAGQGSLKERLAQRVKALHGQEGDERLSYREKLKGVVSAPGLKVLKDIAYGNVSKQSLDVYIPENARNSPLIVMVHGGGWRTGDKEMTGVITHKGTYYVTKGFVFISVNNRLVPEADALGQANDIANAIAFIQKNAISWGADADKMIVIGHSAGAHLVTLLGVDPSPVINLGGHAWSGTIALDSGAMDVPGIMTKKHRGIYDNAFGSNPDQWELASPFHQVTKGATAMMLVCSSNRKNSCPVNYSLAEKGKKLGVNVIVHEEALSHGQINDKLGMPGPYTDAVDAFIESVL